MKCTSPLQDGYSSSGNQSQLTVNPCHPKELAFTGGQPIVVGGLGLLLIVVAIGLWYGLRS